MDDHKVWTTEDFYDLPEGSCIYVQIEEECEGVLYFEGMWCSMAGSYYVSVPASICTDVDPDEEMREKMGAFSATPEEQAHLKKFREIANGR